MSSLSSRSVPARTSIRAVRAAKNVLDRPLNQPAEPKINRNMHKGFETYSASMEQWTAEVCATRKGGRQQDYRWG